MMKRVDFYLSEIQIKKVQSMSKKTGLSASELMRRAIDEYWEKYGGKVAQKKPVKEILTFDDAKELLRAIDGIKKLEKEGKIK